MDTTRPMSLMNKKLKHEDVTLFHTQTWTERTAVNLGYNLDQRPAYLLLTFSMDIYSQKNRKTILQKDNHRQEDNHSETIYAQELPFCVELLFSCFEVSLSTIGSSSSNSNALAACSFALAGFGSFGTFDASFTALAASLGDLVVSLDTLATSFGTLTASLGVFACFTGFDDDSSFLWKCQERATQYIGTI